MKRLINKNWYFRYGEKTDDLNSIDKNTFSYIGLPHTFDLPYYGESGFYVGYGVYKKELYLDEDDLKSLIFLEFLGVFQETEIYVNGEFVKKHRSGYTGFTAEITDFVSVGKNILTVRVNNLWQSDLPPRAGEHLFCGGIYRDVSLITVATAHIKRNGIFVKTSLTDKNSAEISAQIETENADGKNIEINLCDADGRQIFTKEYKAKPLTKISFSLENPILWDIDNPYLYTLQCILGEQTETVSFGIRTIEFSAQNGFFLNGKHLYLEGVNLHQDRGGWGDAGTIEGMRRDLKMMKEAGFNFIRTSHYPRHPFFAQECDRLGLLVWYEAPFWGIGGFKDKGFWNASAFPTNEDDIPSFSENCFYALREMIRANRNSPSIIVWSMGNEVFFTQNNLMPHVKKLLSEMIDLAHNLDNTRPAGVGGTQRGDLHLIGDITGFNGDGAVLFKNPEIPNLVSEYGSIISNRPGKYQLYYTSGAKEQVKWRCGRALWCGFHHGSIADIGKMGIADLYRIPLKSYYCYKEKLTGIKPPSFPKKGKAHHLKIEADKQTIKTDGTDDVRLAVSLRDKNDNLVSDNMKVKLEVISGEGLFPTGKEWIMQPENLTFIDGIGAIEMRSYHSGTITVCASADNVLPSQIEIQAVSDDCEANGEVVHYPQCPPKSYMNTSGHTDLICGRPIWASSSFENHKNNYANDNDDNTYWQPAPEDKNTSLIFDMENFYTPQSVQLCLSKQYVHIKILVSKDKEHWKTVYHNRFIKRLFINKNIKLKKVQGRYLKLELSTADIKVINVKAFNYDN